MRNTGEVPVAVRSLKMSPVRTSFESPWQNGVAERWVESCRRDLLDHVIAVNERHLKRLLSEYVRYYHEDRTHLGLGKETPNCRTPSRSSGRVLSHERLGGLASSLRSGCLTRTNLSPVRDTLE
jgi:putative transposase